MRVPRGRPGVGCGSGLRAGTPRAAESGTATGRAALTFRWTTRPGGLLPGAVPGNGYGYATGIAAALCGGPTRP
ncbi:hypothetical protein GCM10027073_13940 [Streptomyces chlorus]